MLVTYLININFYSSATVKYCNQLQGVSPLNITRKEGEVNVHIDCPFSTTSAPFWRINGSQYGLCCLPPSVYMYSTVYGLTLAIVSTALNQTTFQCLTPSDSTGTHVLSSEVGVLTVIESGKNNR